MASNTQNPIFEFIYVNGDDPEYIEDQRALRISCITDENKTDMILNDEHLYHIGTGHSFGLGFFTTFTTISGIEVISYMGSNIYRASGSNYRYTDGIFVLIPSEPYVKSAPISVDTIKFPIVNNRPVRTLAGDLITVHPR